MARFLQKDTAFGLLCVALAAFGLIQGRRYPIGSSDEMGPGYFPLLLTVLLALLGFVVLANGLRVDGPEVGAIPLRALLATTLPIVFFGLTLRGLGLVLSLTITVLATTFAMRSWNPVVALSTTLVLVVACVAIFVFALGLPLSLFGPWIGGY